MSDIVASKATARSACSKARKRVAGKLPEAGKELAKSVIGSAERLGLKERRCVVSVFLPIGSEIDTIPLIKELVDLDHQVALPVVVKKAAPLIFRQWRTGEPLVDGGYGTSVPLPVSPELTPSHMFVPLLAFDDAGYRLGYGGGFYDRTIQKLRSAGEITTIGVAFSAQQVDTVPRDEFDQPLDWIATELGVREPRGQTL